MARRARRGRPADPTVDARAFEATLDIYSRWGWAALNFDVVAKQAGLGKSTLYGRWTDKGDLLVSALRSLSKEPWSGTSSGCIREDLVAVIHHVIETTNSPDGMIRLRAQLDARQFPELLGPPMEELGRQWTETYRMIIMAAKERGALSENTSPSLVLDTIRGAVLNRILFLSGDRLMSALGGDFPEKLAAEILDGIAA